LSCPAWLYTGIMTGEDEARRLAHEAQEKRRLQIAAWLEAGRLDDAQRDPLDIDLPRTFILDTTATRFRRWLKSTTREAERRKFSAEKGYFTIQRAREQDHTGQAANDVPIITIDALFHEHTGGVFSYPRVIFFSMTNLADGRIAVQATCDQVELAAYYHDLLDRLVEHWSA
jgi:hypothetical protein